MCGFNKYTVIRRLGPAVLTADERLRLDKNAALIEIVSGAKKAAI